MGARNREGVGFSYRPAKLHWLTEMIPLNRFLGSLSVLKYCLLLKVWLGLTSSSSWSNTYLVRSYIHSGIWVGRGMEGLNTLPSPPHPPILTQPLPPHRSWLLPTLHSNNGCFLYLSFLRSVTTLIKKKIKVPHM